MEVTRVRAVVVDIGKGGVLPGDVRHSFGPIIIAEHGLLATDMSGPMFAFGRRLLIEQTVALYEGNGYTTLFASVVRVDR